MKRFLFPLVAFVFFNILTASANQTSDFKVSDLNQESRNAYERLRVARVFSIGPVGYAATTSANELALHTLLKEPESITIFKDLLVNALPEGRLFALYGLYVKDRDGFKKEVQNQLASQKLGDTVNIQSGCIIMIEDTRAVIAQMESGFYDPLFKYGTTSQ